ncbi:SAGA-associated factor 29 [Planococcus citri]|uniref:SAGA-associated factor 29 n=1 Tax=Planococcus citri TaxID=170843 RepID=UPI0031F93522
MAFTDTAAFQVQENLKSLFSLVQDIEKERMNNEMMINNITKTHDKVTSDGKITPYYQQKLKGLYSNAIIEAEKEEEAIRTALHKINEIRTIRHERRLMARNTGNKDTFRRGAHMKMLQVSAQTLPLWVSKIGEKPPPLCAAIPAEPNYIAKSGDMVAALVKSAEQEEEENWILAEVVLYNSALSKYEVDDIDEVQKERHTLSRRRVIPLPLMRANPETEPEALFPKGSVVMALYPQTTCFYKAVVNQLPVTAQDDYEVLFEDSSYDEGFAPPLPVAQRYVIMYKDHKKSTKFSSFMS